MQSKTVSRLPYDPGRLASTQEADPVLGLVITRLRDGKLGKGQSQTTAPLKSVNTGGSTIICCSKRVSYTDEPGLENQRRPSFSFVIWAWSACLTSCVIGSSGHAWLPRLKSTLGSVTHVLPSKPDSQRPPSKTSWPHILWSWFALTICAWNLGRAWMRMFWWSQTISPGIPRHM